jgi:hypothetical protein
MPIVDTLRRIARAVAVFVTSSVAGFVGGSIAFVVAAWALGAAR